ELGNLANLKGLYLGWNYLSGAIPPDLGNLANLVWLGLDGNELTGPIPAELGNLANLKGLYLGWNYLGGTIPPDLGNLTNLRMLILLDNALVGLIPQKLLQLAQLDWLDFTGNAELCAPGTSGFVAWMRGIGGAGGPFCNEADKAALEPLYNGTNGPAWTNSDGWLSDRAVEEWYGITADSLGRITALDLTRNGLAGALPASVGNLAEMTELRVGGNTNLSGRFPLSLAQLPLRALHYSGTSLCAPDDASFQAWLAAIPSHEGTGTECAPLSDREILEILYHATGGSEWTDNTNWLTDAPLRDWFGVYTWSDGRVVHLFLQGNRLKGRIPHELGNLRNLEDLWLSVNRLEGPIPPELGRLSSLERLSLRDNDLTGAIPPELGSLASLRTLQLQRNDLTGPVPPELGNLTNLRDLWLSNNGLTGSIPPGLGNLASVTYLLIDGNDLSGPLPATLGSLTTLEELFLDNNDLSGPVPAEFGGMSSLKQLGLTNNSAMAGALPSRLVDLRQLEGLLAGGTDLCAPSDPDFRAWLDGVQKRRIASCAEGEPPAAYLTQAVQSREFPVPLVAGERALLRVFPTARQATSEGIPDVRARFYRNGRETHVADIPGKSAPIPTEVDESRLSKSANAEIPGHMIQPGLEMVIEVDRNGTLDPTLGVAKRIPAEGRLAVDVRPMPLFDLTLIPFVWTETQDSSIVDLVEAIAADPENHQMLEDTRTLLPIGDLNVTAHDPVLSSSNSASRLLHQTLAIQAMEGGTGYYMGMAGYSGAGPAGIAKVRTRVSFSIPDPGTMAHELGHNMRLYHAPCRVVSSVDPSYPYPDGSIGVWGYDFRDGGSLVRPSRPDLMSYCGTHWIGDYGFTNALRYRLFDEGGPAAAVAERSLLLWGGVDADSVPYLEPAFLVEASAALPDSAGEYQISGRTEAGTQLFALRFAMPETADGDGSSSFAFVLPVRPEWEGSLASVTLSGPGGSTTLDRDSDLPMVILRSPRTGQIRGFLRDPPPAAQAAADAVGQGAGTRIEMLFSRGIPDAESWRR
ncbi:MAG: hypothetical protein F4Z72_04015, partial [Gemmatimonadales bacterium]|nr:hypothetical protein [Candidatus Palauibacter irciniicola]